MKRRGYSTGVLLAILFFPGTGYGHAQNHPVPVLPGRMPLFANNPFKPYVEIVSLLESERAFVKLQNGFHKTVRVTRVYLEEPGQRPLDVTMETPDELAPAESRFLDVTKELLSLFGEAISESQEKVVRICTRLKPEPPFQPHCVERSVQMRNGRLLTFFAEEVDGKKEASP